MTTPNTDLAEQIARALFEADVDGPDTFEEAASWYRRNAAAVLPIVDAAVKRGQAEAWDEGLGAGCDRWMDAREFGDPPINPYREETPDEH